jgi:hypothetical protein
MASDKHPMVNLWEWDNYDIMFSMRAVEMKFGLLETNQVSRRVPGPVPGRRA